MDHVPWNSNTPVKWRTLPDSWPLYDFWTINVLLYVFDITLFPHVGDFFVVHLFGTLNWLFCVGVLFY